MATPNTSPQNGAPILRMVTSVTVAVNAVNAPRVCRSAKAMAKAAWRTRSIASIAIGRSFTGHGTVQDGKTLANAIQLNPDGLLDALASVTFSG